MKKTMIFLLSILLLLGTLSGCGMTSATEPTTVETEQAVSVDPIVPGESAEEAAAPEQSAGPFSPDGSVIFERDGVKVTTAGLDTDPTSLDYQPILWVDIENSGAEDVYLGVADGSVNGFMNDVYLIDFYMEYGEYYGADYDFQLTIPAGETGRYALGYNGQNIPGVASDTLGELAFSFTTAEDEYSWHDYVSEPVVIQTGEPTEDVDITALGTVVIDDETMTLVLGEQDYDDWFGPEITVYVANKTERWIGLSPETAEGNGIFCDYLYGGMYVAPGKKAAGTVSFDGELRELKSIEDLTLTYCLFEADSYDELDFGSAVTLDPISATYPPQVWGEYENGILHLEIKPKYNDLITVETPEDDADGILLTVSETASLVTGGYDGAGWLFSIGQVTEDALHEMLCGDMSGAEVFAKDGDGMYYIYYHPTDVRFERATAEEMESGIAQWTMLNEWAATVPDTLLEQSIELEYFRRGNTDLDMHLARAAYDPDAHYTVNTLEYGPIEADGFQAAPYAETLLDAGFFETERDEAPDGEFISLSFPEEDVRFDFFRSEGNVVREVRGDYEAYYETWFYDESVSCADIMQGWYYALAESAGVKEPDASLDAFPGTWAEQIAGRGVVTIEKSLAPGKATIEASWPDGAAVMYTWKMTGSLEEDGRLVYEYGARTVTEYDENGEERLLDENWEASGSFYLNDAGELVWHDELSGNDEDSVFIRAD